MAKRIKRTRREKMPAGAKYVGRPTKWGNPFRVGDRLGTVPLIVTAGRELWEQHKTTDYELTREDVVRVYEGWIQRQMHWNPAYHDIGQLRGHDLACWCDLDEACHADVLLRLANQDHDTETT